MATRDISRSIIEGGRSNGNKFNRRLSNRSLRRRTRMYTRGLLSLVEVDEGVYPERKQVYKEFRDKIGPVRQWMLSHTGLPWDRVYSKIRKRFDTRTIAGQHVVFDHMLGDVALHPDNPVRRWSRFYIDDAGILRKRESSWNWRAQRRANAHPTFAELYKWAGVRKICDYGNGKVFWMVPESKDWCICWEYERKWGIYGCKRPHLDTTRFVEVPPHSVLGFEKKSVRRVQVNGVTQYFREVPTKKCLRGKGAYTQGGRLSEKDLEIWNRLRDYARKEFLWTPGSYA